MFPSSLDDLSISRASAGSQKLNAPNHLTHHVNEDTAIQAIQTKIGIDGSAVATSLDYLVKNAASIDPGHKHSLICATGTDTSTSSYSSGNFVIQAKNSSGTVVSRVTVSTGTNATLTVGTTVTVTSLTNSSLTSGRVTYATTSGLLTDSAAMTFNGYTFEISGVATNLPFKVSVADGNNGYWAFSRQAGYVAGFLIRTSGVNRWLFGANSDSEIGSNAGSNYVIYPCNDAGDTGTASFSIIRSTGEIITNYSYGATQDFTMRSDNYVTLFSDASNDSIAVMYNASGKLGFFGKAPISQEVLATGAGKTVDNVITALQNIGLVKQS